MSIFCKDQQAKSRAFWKNQKLFTKKTNNTVRQNSIFSIITGKSQQIMKIELKKEDPCIGILKVYIAKQPKSRAGVPLFSTLFVWIEIPWNPCKLPI